MAKGSLSPSDYKSEKPAGAKRKRVTMGNKDPIYKAAVKQPHNLKGKCET